MTSNVDLVKASETVGRLCDRIEQLERELEKWKDIADATESLKQQYGEMLTAERALADQLAAQLQGWWDCSDTFPWRDDEDREALAAYRKARGL